MTIRSCVSRTITWTRTNIARGPASMASWQKPPLFSFGVIADVQYSDIDDGYNFTRTRKRYYRNALKLLEDTVKQWIVDRDRKPGFVLQLGDLIDGYSAARGRTNVELCHLTEALKPYEGYICHLWGNHEFYNFTRSELLGGPLNSRSTASTQSGATTSMHVSGICDSMPIPTTNSSRVTTAKQQQGQNENMEEIYCFSFHPHSKFRFICLDSYDISIIGRDRDSWQYAEAMAILKSHNKNDNFNSPDGLMEPWYVKFNGGVSQKQLSWLRNELQEATDLKQNVIVVSHIPFYPDATDGMCLIWNYSDVLGLIHSFSCVIACICGHDHEGGFAIDKNGIHHYTFPAILECKPGTTAYATVDVYEDQLLLNGEGKVSSSCIKTIFSDVVS